MRHSFVLPVKAFSINQLYYGNRSHGKTAAATEWSYHINHSLSETNTAAGLEKLRNIFDPKKHSYHISLTFLYPKDQFENKAGIISSRTQDLSNCEKAVIDLIFLPKNFGTNAPYTAPNLNIDDKFITEMVSRKGASIDGKYHIVVSLEIIERGN